MDYSSDIKKNMQSVMNSEEVIEGEEVGYIYFLWDGDKIVYVGQTKYNPSVRTLSHYKSKDKKFDRFSYIECPKSECKDAEAYYIFKYCPIYNKEIPKSERYKMICASELINHCGGNKKLKLNAVIIGRNIYVEIK